MQVHLTNLPNNAGLKQKLSDFIERAADSYRASKQGKLLKPCLLFCGYAAIFGFKFNETDGADLRDHR
jgi:hypothetical protein